MNKALLIISLVVFAFIAVSCGGTEEPPARVTDNTARPSPPPKKEPPAEVKYLEQKCGSCHQIAEFAGKLQVMNLDDFTAALNNEENHKDLDITDDEKAKILEFFENWKSSEKTTTDAETPAPENDEEPEPV